MKSSLFTFLLLLFLVKISFAQTVQVEAGTNVISEAVNNANPGDVIELTTDGGEYFEETEILVNKKITIKSADGITEKPTIISNSASTIFEMEDGCHLTFEGIKLDGLLGGTATFYAFHGGISAVYDLFIENGEFYNFENFVFAVSSKGDTLKVNNSLIAHTFEENVFDLSEDGVISVFELTNSTIWDVNDYVTYVENPTTSFLVDHVTIYSEGKGEEKMIYPKYAHNAVIKNSILATAKRGSDIPLAIRLYNNDSAAEYVLTWNTLGIGLEDGATIDSTKIILEADPMFVDPDNGNFDLMEGSPAIGYAESGNNLGDPRWKVTTATNIVEEGIEIPSDFNLFQNYPNPFNPTTSINYSLKAESHVTLEIFNILGNKVRSLVNERQSAGNYTISWDGRNDKYQKLSSGVYLYKINCDNFISIKKMIKLK